MRSLLTLLPPTRSLGAECGRTWDSWWPINTPPHHPLSLKASPHRGPSSLISPAPSPGVSQFHLVKSSDGSRNCRVLGPEPQQRCPNMPSVHRPYCPSSPTALWGPSQKVGRNTGLPLKTSPFHLLVTSHLLMGMSPMESTPESPLGVFHPRHAPAPHRAPRGCPASHPVAAPRGNAHQSSLSKTWLETRS
ncbi:hypothetical protein HJG60_009379 [Phyllostomus discolor]|uniref:Uncharacterized protein n=1 Tax=Phyllostomus discolor TaxID=89673 RepID=A0A833YIE1_9CHIR|nr:hypothetical protein HJG60_009379 [Phyllostomus discolor]